MQTMVRQLMAGAAVTTIIALGPTGLMAQQQQDRQHSVDEPVQGSNTAEKPKPEDVHRTQPGDQYQPEHNILSDIPTEQPGAKPACRSSVRRNSRKPRKSTSSAAPGAWRAARRSNRQGADTRPDA